MSKREWVWRASSDQSYIVIDNRIDNGGDYQYSNQSNKLWLKATPKHKWTPLLYLEYSERFTWEEFEKYAQVIVDRLNAYETEKMLKGEE